MMSGSAEFAICAVFAALIFSAGGDMQARGAALKQSHGAARHDACVARAASFPYAAMHRHELR